jgi:hypothetical protein
VALSLLLPSLSAAVQNQTSAAIALLRTANPKVQWDAKSAAMADITGDGVRDVIAAGYDDKSVWVALVPGLKDGKLAKPVVQQFLINAGRQDGFCGKPVRIELFPLDCEGLSGCKASTTAFSFGLYDDKCDHFNFYWDSDLKTLRWWRN